MSTPRTASRQATGGTGHPGGFHGVDTRDPVGARIKQYKLTHDSVRSLEDRPMRTEFVDRPHPFLVRRIIRAVRDLGDFAADDALIQVGVGIPRGFKFWLPSGPKPEGGIGPIFLSRIFRSMIAINSFSQNRTYKRKTK